MKVLDTDILSLLFANHARVVARYQAEAEEVVSTVVSRIEILQGRFATLVKAADGGELLVGQERLNRAESDLATLEQLPVDESVADEFDRLLPNKKLKKIGRGDLLIAAISLANGATLVTRNEKDFRPVPKLRIENWAD